MNFQPPHAGLLAYSTYGSWGVQRPEHGTLGRYSPDMTKLLPDGRTFALTLRLDRAAYQLYREFGASHKQALHNSLLCPAWAGLHNAPGHGSWEIELQAPASDRVELLDLCTSAGFGAAGRRRVQRSDHALQSCSSAV